MVEEQHIPLLRGRYRLLEEVGSGIMSRVHRAEDTKLGQKIVAVKLFESTYDGDLVYEVFRRETEALRRLEHPYIVELLDHNWSPEVQKYFLVLEYLPRTLADELKARQGKLDRAWCWKLAREIAEGLEYAHGQAVIHRDLKPTNILLTDEGIPKLTDFGSSYLKTELGNPITVRSFYTPEYASPEQLQEQQATEKSDIYAFGCTLYHLFSGHLPPSRRSPHAQGITPEMIQTLGLAPLDASILESMVADDPAQRPATCTLLLRQLAHTKEYEDLPELWLNITRSARRAMGEAGLIPYADDELAKAFLLNKELGGDRPKEVQMLFVPEKGSLRLLTDRLVLICVRHASIPALSITGLYTTYMPELEREKQYALPLRYRWKTATEPTILFSLRGRTDLEAPLSQLFHQLQTHQQTKQVDRVRKNEQREFTRAWSAALKLRRQQLDRAEKLIYTSWVRHSKTITFTLQGPVPEDLVWPENAALAIGQGGKTKQTALSVGTLLGFGDGEVHVSSQPQIGLGPEPSRIAFPLQGSIGLDLRQERSQVNRLDEAVRTLLSGGTANHHLIDILMDLSQAVFEQEEEISSYYQSALAEDKKRAVKKALAARDLFLLQGPPGTGKTTALAELILQILDRQPDARILVTSQSNVAVDHILLKVAEVARERGIEMVRIGRADKIGAGAEIWTIEQRQANWRTTILSRTEPKLTALNAQVQELRRQRKQRQTQNPEETAVLEQWKTRMDELGPELQAMEEDERHREELIRYSQAFQPLAEARQEMEEEEEQCRIRLEERKARIMAVLTQLCAVLAETDEAIQQGKLIEEYQRLGQIVLKRLGIEPEEAAAEQWIQFLKDWRAVAGIGEAFAEPLLARASILAATCLATGREAFRDRRFDWAIIDEAGRATAPELLVPLVRARRAILVGDERQLPPMVDSELSEKELASVGVSRESLTESLFGTLVKEAQEAHLPIVQMLTAQHRMHPAIGRLISEVFYEGKLEHAVTEQERRHELTWVPKCIVWYTTTRLSQHEETPRGSSFSNRVEVDRCLMLLRQMETDYRALDQRREVAVISPYNAQIAELRAAIRPGGPDWHALHIVIAAVDAFQGKDSDIVLYSLVRSNQQARLGFLRDERRLNVALSRARQLLLLIGDLWTLENGRAGSEAENPYRRLITYLREHEEDCAIEHLEEI